MPSYTRKVRKLKPLKANPQKGGYYFSVYHGIQNASLLLPLAFRQAHRLLSRNTKARKTKARKTKARNKK
jgi:hypothetical protein